MTDKPAYTKLHLNKDEIKDLRYKLLWDENFKKVLSENERYYLVAAIDYDLGGIW
jgi:hypothetical protein